MCQQKKESGSTEKVNPLPDSGEVFAEGEGLFVSFGLDGIGFAHLEGGAADEAGAASEGEGNRDGFEELVVAVVEIDGFFLHDVDADEKGRGLLGCVVGGNGWHFTHTSSDSEDGATFDDEWGEVAVKSFFW